MSPELRRELESLTREELAESLGVAKLRWLLRLYPHDYCGDCGGETTAVRRCVKSSICTDCCDNHACPSHKPVTP